jgi:hypothetical protein
MSLPSYVKIELALRFTPDEIEVIERNWDIYSNGFRFSSSTGAQMRKQAKMVLGCVKEHGDGL